MRIELISHGKKRCLNAKVSGKNWSTYKIRCGNCKKLDTLYIGSYVEVESYIFNTNKVHNQKCKNCGSSGQFEYKKQ
jgi:formate dehydrogenase maturation protein FdhE